MKNIHLKIKHFFCLVLSFILLTPSGALFAQNMDLTIQVPSTFVKDITPVNLSLYEAQTAFDDLVKALDNNSKDVPKLLTKYKEKAEIAAQNYFDYVTNLRSFERYLDDISEVGVLKRLASQYAERQTKIPTVYNIKENIIVGHFRNKIAGLNESNIYGISKIEIQELTDIHSSLITKFEGDILSDYSKLHSKLAKINEESARIIRTYYQPTDVLLAAYEDLVANKKIAFRANLNLREHPEKLGLVIKDIRRYLRTTNPNKSPVFSFFKLLRELRGMNTVEREAYVEFLTDLKPGQKQLLRDIGALEDKGVRKLTTRKMLKVGPLLIVGTILTVATISEVNAQNHFSNESINSYRLKQISDNIKAGNVSPTEAIEYYSSAASESVLLEDIDHALGFAEFSVAKSNAEDDMDIIEDIINNDPELQITFKQPNININIDPNKMINKYSLPR